MPTISGFHSDFLICVCDPNASRSSGISSCRSVCCVVWVLSLHNFTSYIDGAYSSNVTVEAVQSSSDNLGVLNISFMLWEIQCIVHYGHAYHCACLA